jgi:hyperosmotically inducible protein
MINTSTIACFALTALLATVGCERKTEAEPDNTARNQGDGSAANKTPFDQSESNEDIQVTAEIRRAILDNSVLSVNAQNCKIMTDKSGVVTLRGVVLSQAEKEAIETTARSVRGVTRVDNQLEIKVD